MHSKGIQWVCSFLIFLVSLSKWTKKCIAIFIVPPGSSNCGMKKKSRMVISIKQMVP